MAGLMTLAGMTLPTIYALCVIRCASCAGFAPEASCGPNGTFHYHVAFGSVVLAALIPLIRDAGRLPVGVPRQSPIVVFASFSSPSRRALSD
jgi:hypothetical protein